MKYKRSIKDIIKRYIFGHSGTKTREKGAKRG